ncbi:TMV resistance protein N-like [Neltuma alba]|uniref:TMV resistance protein N-like n=1 Tax=Neltuma alba TaxID=207710 RepID=UPI0010A4B163|nr:TMV resistance protein N-like [Prosopis alba]
MEAASLKSANTTACFDEFEEMILSFKALELNVLPILTSYILRSLHPKKTIPGDPNPYIARALVSVAVGHRSSGADSDKTMCGGLRISGTFPDIKFTSCGNVFRQAPVPPNSLLHIVARRSAMASSSSSAPSSQSPKKYDVFISFRGEDTRLNFTSHLYHALCGQKIYAYIDDSLEKGDEVWPSLEKAIEDSTLFLVVFSENYASSTWCLKELAKILECCRNQRHLLIPVFYRVDPSDVRKQRGSYHEAFEGHERKSSINTQQLRQWREALTHAANLSGWHCSPDRNEAVLIEEIVNCIMKELDRRYQSEDHLKGLIGIHKRMAVVESMLDTGSKNGGCQFIGIWGMGGLDKTTLVRALYDKRHFEYEGSYFLEKVGEKLKKDGIDALRKELVWSLLGGKAIYSHIMTRLRRTKVFIVLDDVDNAERLENLVGRCEFGSGSKVLITSRDKQVLRTKVDDNNIYALHGLDPYEAFQLFSLNAFKTGCSDLKIRELAEEVTKYAGGNPLALKVLGSTLRGKNQEAWKSQLAKLQKLFCPEVIDILKLSFEGLDKEEKNIVLHVACFFNYYYDAEDVKKLLDPCGYSTEIGLARLEKKPFRY